VDCESVYVVLL